MAQVPFAWQTLSKIANQKNLNKAFAFSTDVVLKPKPGVQFTVWGLDQSQKPVALETGANLPALFKKYGPLAGCALITES